MLGETNGDYYRIIIILLLYYIFTTVRLDSSSTGVSCPANSYSWQCADDLEAAKRHKSWGLSDRLKSNLSTELFRKL